MLTLLCVAGCASLGEQSGALRFVAAPLPASLCADSGPTIEGARLRFFVSEVVVFKLDGKALSARLDVDDHADGRVKLVSMPLSCHQAQSVSLPLTLPLNAHALEFTLGVPEAANHANPLRALPPLSDFDMHWAWQSGYKFLSLDLGNVWSFHLGSTGCFSQSPVRPPERECAQPNRVRVRVSHLDPWPVTLGIDVGALIEGLDPSDLDNCVGEYRAKAHCRELLARLGLDAMSGQCVDDCMAQRLFRRLPSRDGS